MMETSDRGRAELAGHEGIVPGPYLDSVGVWTFGVGHTAAAGAPDPKSMPRGMPANIGAAIDGAMDLFAKDLKRYEARVNDVINVPLEQHEFDALVSFDYNTGGIYRANLTKAINAGDPEAWTHFMGWSKPASIIPRREKEQALFRDGVYANTAVSVWNVDTNGKLRGVYDSIPVDDLVDGTDAADPEAVLMAIRDMINQYFEATT